MSVRRVIAYSGLAIGAGLLCFVLGAYTTQHSMALQLAEKTYQDFEITARLRLLLRRGLRLWLGRRGGLRGRLLLGHVQRPCHLAGRFCRNASRPSRKSSLV